MTHAIAAVGGALYQLLTIPPPGSGARKIEGGGGSLSASYKSTACVQNDKEKM